MANEYLELQKQIDKLIGEIGINLSLEILKGVNDFNNINSIEKTNSFLLIVISKMYNLKYDSITFQKRKNGDSLKVIGMSILLLKESFPEITYDKIGKLYNFTGKNSYYSYKRAIENYAVMLRKRYELMIN